MFNGTHIEIIRNGVSAGAEAKLRGTGSRLRLAGVSEADSTEWASPATPERVAEEDGGEPEIERVRRLRWYSWPLEQQSNDKAGSGNERQPVT
jgi:hypothetical protein